MASGTTLQTSLTASHQEHSPIATASAPNPHADLKEQDQPSSQDLDFAKLKKANGAVQKLISLAEERQSDRTFFQRASDWILRIKQPETIQFEAAKINLQKAEEHLTLFERTHSPQELQQAKDFEKTAFSEVQNYHSAYSDYQINSLDRGENFYFKVGVGGTVASIIFGGAAFVLGGGAILGGTSLGVGGIASRSIALVGTLGINGLGILALHRLTHPISFEGIESVDQVLSPFDEVKREQVEEAFDILKGRTPFNPGHFTIKGELLDNFSTKKNLSLGFLRSTIEAFQNLWDSQLDKYETLAKRETDPLKQVEKPVMAMRADYMKLYWSFQARLIGLIQGLGGNCEARSLALTSFAMRSGTIPSGWRPVAQKFHDHIQTVLYRNAPGEKEKVWDLLTGVITEGEPQAPLYDLKLFVHAYLEGEGITAPVSEESLLIRDVSWSKKVGSWIAKYVMPPSNSKLKFLSGAGWYLDKPPPEKAYDLPDAYGKPVSPKILSSETVSPKKVPFTRFFNAGAEVKETALGKKNIEEVSYKAFLLSEIDDEARRKDLELRVKANPLRFSIETVYKDGVLNEKTGQYEPKQDYNIIFEDQQIRDDYRQLKNDQLEREFLFRIANNYFSKTFTSSAADIYNSILQDYQIINHYSSDQLAQIAKLKTDLRTIYIGVFRVQVAVYGPDKEFWKDLRFPDDSANDASKKINDYFSSHHPFWNKFNENTETLEEQINANPQRFIYFINNLPHQKRENFLKIIEPSRIKNGVKDLISDPQKVGIGELKITPYPVIFSEGDLPVEEESPDLLNKSESKEKKDGEVIPDLKSQISAECFIDLLLADFDNLNDKFFRRWDKNISKEFIELNKDGKYDDKFIQYYHLIIRAREHMNSNYGIEEKLNKKEHQDIREILEQIKKRKGFNSTH